MKFQALAKVVGLLLLCNVTASDGWAAPQRTGSTTQGSNAAHTISISNFTNSSVPVSFQISCDSGQSWTSFFLNPNAVQGIICSTGTFLFSIATNTGNPAQPAIVNYNLQDTHKYALVLNQNGVFDLTEPNQ